MTVGSLLVTMVIYFLQYIGGQSSGAVTFPSLRIDNSVNFLISFYVYIPSPANTGFVPLLTQGYRLLFLRPFNF